PLVAAPTDALRSIEAIPPGAGYSPRSDSARLNIYESAALQERARKDHQTALQVVQRAVLKLGGTTFYNNNIDLFARVGEGRYLVEAKSISTPASVVDRMRYGIGQLADYSYRYDEQLGGARRVLAFAAQPPRELSWISSILENERIAFIATYGEHVVALNATANELPFVAERAP
ncbi:MAG: hypothetical protein ABSD03_16520, partial [Vulcanimicrobiaceae bacterium]